MEEPKTEFVVAATFSSDVMAVYKTYEQALRRIECDSLSLKTGRAIRAKIKLDTSTFRDSSYEFLNRALKQLRFPTGETSPQANSLILALHEALDQFHADEELISIIVGIEENLAITRSLLRAWTLETLKSHSVSQQYRNSNLKLFFNLNSNMTILEELRSLETDEGIAASNEITTKLTNLFFQWWKNYYSPDRIEENLI